MLALLTKIILILFGIGAFITVGIPMIILGVFYIIGFIGLTATLLFQFTVAVIDIIISPFRR